MAFVFLSEYNSLSDDCHVSLCLSMSVYVSMNVMCLSIFLPVSVCPCVYDMHDNAMQCSARQRSIY